MARGLLISIMALLHLPPGPLISLLALLHLPSPAINSFSRSHSQPGVDLSLPPRLAARQQLTNYSVPTGGTARLHCTITNVEQEAISWIRLADYRILTNGLVTFTTDDRFSVLHSPDSGEWTLQLRGALPRDQGQYQCQAATSTGVRTLTSWLWVHRPRAAILGSREKHVNLGDSVVISCELRDNVGRPEFVFWYHNDTMINFQPGVSVVTAVIGADTSSLWVAPPNTTVSRLRIAETRADHAGNYSCSPPHTVSDSIRLSVSADSGHTQNMRQVERDMFLTGGGQHPHPHNLFYFLLLLNLLPVLPLPLLHHIDLINL